MPFDSPVPAAGATAAAQELLLRCLVSGDEADAFQERNPAGDATDLRSKGLLLCQRCRLGGAL